MKCPYCGYQESKVVDSRHSDDGLSIRRRRECLQCQKRFTTYETVESLPIVVIKRDSSRQQFDRNKILNGMLRAWSRWPSLSAPPMRSNRPSRIRSTARSLQKRSASSSWSA